MPELTPLDDNRQEHFLNGEDLEPITRREHFYAGRESELPAGHQEPETREEWFIQKYRGGGGDVTVVPLSVTENGTYSEEGKAYSPVSVNVPLPQNAYLLKSVANLPQAIASFNDGEDMVMPTLKVAIEPQQGGSGDPSPTNIRPISGWDEANVVDDSVYGGFINWNQLITSPSSGTSSDITLTKLDDGTCKVNGIADNTAIFYCGPDDSKIILGHKYYVSGCPSGGSENTYMLSFRTNSAKIIIGNETGSGKVFTFTDSSITNRSMNVLVRIMSGTTANNLIYKPVVVDLTQVFGSTKADEIYAMEQAQAGSGVAYFKSLFYKDYYPYNSGEITNVSAVNGDTDKYHTYTIALGGTYYGGWLDVVNGKLYAYPYYASYNGETLVGEWISSLDAYAEGTTPTTGAQVLNIGAEPTVIDISTPCVKSLEGVNNLFADSGQVQELSYFSKEV